MDDLWTAYTTLPLIEVDTDRLIDCEWITIDFIS